MSTDCVDEMWMPVPVETGMQVEMGIHVETGMHVEMGIPVETGCLVSTPRRGMFLHRFYLKTLLSCKDFVGIQ